jgi:tetratricopeptide (TPR) repeat protein
MANNDSNFDVFLSHNSGDKDRVRLLAKELSEAGLRVWFDEWIIKPGDDIYLAVEGGLNTSRVLVLCLSPAALGSGWVDLERSTALFRDPTNRARRFIPVLLADSQLPDSLRRYRYIDLRYDSRSAHEELLASCRGDDSVHGPAGDCDPDLKALMSEAKRACRRHNEAEALRLWGEVRQRAHDAKLDEIVVTADLETVFVRLQHGADIDEVLSDLDRCIAAAATVALGHERTRMLQLLGEAHRIKRNWDQARGTLTKALELARSSGRPDDEGWALLALSVVEHDRSREKNGSGTDLINKAYDCFAAAYATGDKDMLTSSRQGFANCHFSRAKILDHNHFDDAMAEYARAIRQYEELGEDFQWDVATMQFERGELQSRTQEAQGAARDFIEAAERFKALKDHLGQARCVLELATLLDSRGLRSQSLPYYEEAVRLSLVQELLGRGAWLWFRLGCKLIELGQVDDARAVFFRLLANDHLHPGQKLDIHKMLCMAAKVTADKEALETHSKAAIDLIDEQINRVQSGTERRRLTLTKGQLFADMDQHEKAEMIFRRSIESFEALGDQQGVIECWFAIAGQNRSPEKRKEERAAYEHVLQLVGEDHKSFFRQMSLAMLAQLDIGEERFDDARRNLDLAEEENKSINNPVVWLLVQDLRTKLK